MSAAVATAPAVRARQCPLCETPAGEPCQPQPAADHLARYLDAYTAGHLSKAYMAMAVGELVVIDGCMVIAESIASGTPVIVDADPWEDREEDERCPRCRAVSWGMDEDGRLECTRCGWTEPAGAQ